MAVINTTRYETLDEFRENTNEISNRVGDTTTLTTTATDLANAIIEHESDIGDMSLTGLDATDISEALREIRVDIGDVGAAGVDLKTTATDLTASLNEIYDDLYTDNSVTFTTDLSATSFIGAIEEIIDEVGQVTSLTTDHTTTTVGAINELDAELGTITADAMGTTASTVSGAIAEHEDDLYTSTTGSFDGLTAKHFKGAIEEIIDEVGQVTSLTTEHTATTVGAINELHSDIGTLSLNSSFDATNLTAAINELDNEKVYLTSSTEQDLNTDLELASGKTLTISGTIDISNGQIIVPAGAGGVYSINTSYIQVGDPGADNATSGGLILSRGDAGADDGSSIDDVRFFWDETAKTWKIKAFTDTSADTPVTSEVVTRFNAFNLFANNSETGINVSWDETNQNFDVNVKDNGIALGTKTTGNYVATVAGTANEIEVSGSGSETAAVTVGLVNEPVVGGLTAGQVKIDVGTNGGNITTSSGALNIDSFTNAVNINANTAVSGTLSSSAKASLESVEVTNDVTIGGDLIVNGTTTTVNSNEVSIGDNILVLNADEAGTPSQNGGVEIERGTSTNTSILWNETSDRWQITDTAGTHNILREAYDTTLTVRDGDGTNVAIDSNDTIQFSEGSGIDINFTDTAEPLVIMQVTNTDRGSSQAIFKRIIAENQDGSDIATITADNNNDILYIREGIVGTTQGIQLGVDATNDRLTISHADTSSAANLTSNNSGNTFIQDISFTYDDYGHVTASSVSTATVNQTDFVIRDADGTGVTIDDGKYLQVLEGNGIDVNFTDVDNGTSADPFDLTITNTKPFDYFVLEDGDGTEISIANQKEVKFIEGSANGATIDINWTDTSTGSDADPYDLTFTVTNTKPFDDITIIDGDGTEKTINNNQFVKFIEGTGVDVSWVDNTNDGNSATTPYELKITASSQLTIYDVNGDVLFPA